MGLTSGGSFWTSSPNKDPKRAFRFKVEIGDSGTIWYAKTAQRPTVSFAETSHSFMNHTYYWPGKAEWNEISITFIDPVDPDLGGNLIQAVADSGYTIPAGTSNMTSMSKKSVMESLGGAGNDIRIHVIDEEGAQLETWSLKHAWIKSIDFSDLDYGSDDMSEITVAFRYDWATFASQNGQVIFGEPV